MKKTYKKTKLLISILLLITLNAFAHDPVFSPGPHVLFKEGIEIHTGIKQKNTQTKQVLQQPLIFKYGVTANWVTGLELPYISQQTPTSTKGFGDIRLTSKYRFWRQDRRGQQRSAALLVNIKTNSSDNKITTNTTDATLGLAYGYESLSWYRWVSARYRFNQNNELRRGNIAFFDVAIGYRYSVNDYKAADMVYMLEVNSEIYQASYLAEQKIIQQNKKLFISPGFMWTLRNMAIKGGVQLPLYQSSSNNQDNYRAKLTIEWHL